MACTGVMIAASTTAASKKSIPEISQARPNYIMDRWAAISSRVCAGEGVTIAHEAETGEADEHCLLFSPPSTKQSL
jgi:hypothetical protein